MANINYAASANGGTAVQSTQFLPMPGYPSGPAQAIDGIRNANFGSGNISISDSGISASNPWIYEVTFPQSRQFNELDVIFVQESPSNTAQPTLTDTCTNSYRVIDFTLEYFNGTSWIVAATVTGNNKVWRQFTGLNFQTNKVRLKVTQTGDTYCRMQEFEAYAAPPPTIDTASPLPNAVINQFYSQNIIASGGTGSVSYSYTGTLPPGLTLPASGLLSGTPTATGSYSFTVTATDAASQTATKTFALAVVAAPALPYGFAANELQLFVEANQMTQANNSIVSSAIDYSPNGRNLTAASAQPTFQTNVINGKSVFRFDGTNNPLKNAAFFSVRCGWILAKYNGAAFPADAPRGLLGGINYPDVLVGNAGDVKFFNFGIPDFQFRSNDRVYSQSNQAAPLNKFNLIFFRYAVNWDGVQIGQQRDLIPRKWIGDIALVILSSVDFYDEEVSRRSKLIADAYGLSLYDAISDFYYNQPQLPEYYIQNLPDWEKITRMHEYEDGGMTFNEVNLVAPITWELTYTGLSMLTGEGRAAVAAMDAHYNANRMAKTFNFYAKDGTTYANVQYKSYEKSHEKNKSWIQTRKITLVKYP